jgi:Flp pilus assembly protein TadG
MKLMHKLVLGMGERGQVAMMVAGMLPILLGMTGMSVDVATYMGDRRHLQNSADSMALAGAQALPDATAARTVAEQWAV